MKGKKQMRLEIRMEEQMLGELEWAAEGVGERVADFVRKAIRERIERERTKAPAGEVKLETGEGRTQEEKAASERRRMELRLRRGAEKLGLSEEAIEGLVRELQVKEEGGRGA
jgi:metal-responsive CopG/Arc/MetJ family transcriptional regulator